MSAPPKSPGVPITDRRQLVEYHANGSKPPAAWRVGTEHEKFVFRHRDRRRAPYEGPDGIAADCSRLICEYADRHPDSIDRTVALIGRAGALYPFIRSSALLRHVDGRTRNVPVVLLYPGERRGPTGLSFMGILSPDNDYLPRIYP